MTLLLGLAAICWAGYGLVTGRGYYKGCPPGGYDRTTDPFSFWAPTIVILAIGVFSILLSLGLISLPTDREISRLSIKLLRRVCFWRGKTG